MVNAIIEEEIERKGIMSRFFGIFGKNDNEEEPEAPKYNRRLLDGRIEKYLDQNLNSYIQEYGIVTSLDLESYEMRYERITGGIASMKEYQLNAEARISGMEIEVKEIKKVAKIKK